MNRTGNLFKAIVSFNNLWYAAHKAWRGKKAKTRIANFYFNLEHELIVLQEELLSGQYQPLLYQIFEVTDPNFAFCPKDIMFPYITTWLSLIPPTQDQLTTELLIMAIVEGITALQLWRAKLTEKKLLLNSPDCQRYPQSTGFALPKRSGISFKKSTIAALGLIFWLPSHPAFAWQEENPLAYRPLPTPPIQQFHHPTGLTRWFLFPLTVYSNTISRVDGERCPSFPNCSQYAKEAILRHGAIPGIWLAIDRLIHERTEIQREDRIRLQDGSLRVPDTLDANDFWFYKHNN